MVPEGRLVNTRRKVRDNDHDSGMQSRCFRVEFGWLWFCLLESCGLFIAKRYSFEVKAVNV